MSTSINIHPSGFPPKVAILRPEDPFATVDVDEGVAVLESNPERLRGIALAFLSAADLLEAAIEAASAAPVTS